MRTQTACALLRLLGISFAASADTLDFATFVSSSSISAEEGQNNTIAFNFAGNKFVGSLYFGGNNAQLYPTNLSGGNVQPFGTPIPTASGEVVAGASLGQGGFPTGDVYIGSEGGGNIYHMPNTGGSPTLFATLPSSAGVVRQRFFDPGTSFGGNMLVTTTSGQVYSVTSAGHPSMIANIW